MTFHSGKCEKEISIDDIQRIKSELTDCRESIDCPHIKNCAKRILQYLELDRKGES